MTPGAAASDGLFRAVFEGCLSGHDIGIEQRPYHRNCGCALHKSQKGKCAHSNRSGKKVSYPIRRSWSEGCLALAVASATSPTYSASSSPSSSPAVTTVIGLGLRSSSQLSFFIEEDDDDNDCVSFKV